MTRVAIVTGGTRGIGEAICLALQEQGRTVVANYAGNEEKAKAFTERTGIKAYRWDVGDFEATQEGCARVAAEVGAVDIVVNNAGITRDGVLHKMSFDDWNEVMRINLGGCFNMAKATFPGMRERAGAASLTSARSTARPGNMARSTMPPPNRASTASPRRWRRKAPSMA
jgi:acetoacetyl-CoA reductase